MRGVTIVKMQLLVQVFISTHTPHARRDCPPSVVSRRSAPFQLTRLMRGVTSAIITKLTLPTFQLTRLMRGVTGRIVHL